MNQSGISQCSYSGLAIVDNSAYDSLPADLASMAALPDMVGECTNCICNDTCISLSKEVLEEMLSQQDFSVAYNGSNLTTKLQTWGYMHNNLQESDLTDIELIPQPDNKFDSEAILVRAHDKNIGYIPRSPEKPELFKWLQQGNTVNILAIMQMGKDTVQSHQLEFNLGSDTRIDSNAPDILSSSIDPTPQDTPATMPRDNEPIGKSNTDKPIACAYKFEGFTYLKPNLAKAGSSNWSKNWVGYVSLKGQYWESKLGKGTRPFAGIQVTVNRSSNGTLAASQYSGSRQYRYNGIISPAIGGKDNFIKAVNYYINSIGFDDMVAAQLASTNLSRNYTIEKKVVVK